jgi:hypothetical protein
MPVINNDQESTSVLIHDPFEKGIFKTAAGEEFSVNDTSKKAELKMGLGHGLEILRIPYKIVRPAWDPRTLPITPTTLKPTMEKKEQWVNGCMEKYQQRKKSMTPTEIVAARTSLC